jgi:hypothetical protein
MPSEQPKSKIFVPADESEDILDLEAYVVPPPPRRQGKIKVRLIYKGRGRPILEHCSDADIEIE